MVKEADALSAAGYEVSVICASFLDWGMQHDAAIVGRPWRIAARIPFGPLASPRIRIKQIVRQRAARTALAIGFGSNNTVREAEWHPASPDITAAALGVEADLYIAHYPAALPAAAKAAARHGARYAFDAEDFHLGDLPDSTEHEHDRERLRAIEGAYLPGAAYVTAASPGIADAYARAYGIMRPNVILNAFPLSHAPERPTPCGTAEPGPSLYWFSQTIGPDRGLETAVAAIGKARSKPHLYLRGRQTPGYINHLRTSASSSQVAARIHVLPIESPEKMERLAAHYDLGLVAETAQTQNRAICLTNKIFSFLLAGLPPMISATPAQRAFARSCGLDALVYEIDNAEVLASRLDEALQAPGRLASLRARCFALGQERFNWERESRILLDCVASVLSNNRAYASE
ncbi:hypothetical protein HUN39_16715 [Methylocystis sp. FS]|uniref:glycosyltransferase n=1 Tax=Methylocystis silviterrae TaxID=2743612 RepID=UPI001581EDE2|nr:glycosyltransferase [Methylocystis silviterrae]NUJ81636.1 hypothetical protein [Methylocystis silviterrae]